jgi:2-octaprenyl-6-methoxyphenol hydroxylase
MTSEPSGEPDSASLHCDVAIVGGGMVGMSLAAALAGAGLGVVLVDAQAAPAAVDPRRDGRSSAIAFGARQALAGIGVWGAMAAGAQPIRRIRVSDGTGSGQVSGLFLDYDPTVLAGRGPSLRRALGAGLVSPGQSGAPPDADGFDTAALGAGATDPLGYIVENRTIREALLGRLAVLDGLTHLRPVRVAHMEPGPGRATLQLADGRRVTAALVVAADGGDSPLRAAAGIPATQWDYPQTAIVCTVTHSLPHGGVAHEHFQPSGPFAMLPMVDDPASGAHRSSVVWTERNALAPAMLRLDDAHFAFEMQRRFGDSLGRLALAGGRWAFPLRLLHAERYVDDRRVLVGDAAHVLHPIAGQGLNLGLKDVAALAEVLVDAWRLGLDPGSAAVLGSYARWRRVDTVLLIAATDGLNRLFSNDFGPLRLARDLGLAAVDRVPPLKRLLMRDAMGTLGELPRLIRGDAL